AVPLFRQRPKRFCQNLEFSRLQRGLAGLGQKTIAFHPNEIANIKQIENRFRFRPDLLLVQINLNPSGRVPEIDKLTLAHVAVSGDPPRGAESFTILEFVTDFGDRPRRFKRASEWFHSPRSQSVELLSALSD